MKTTFEASLAAVVEKTQDRQSHHNLTTISPQSHHNLTTIFALLSHSVTQSLSHSATQPLSHSATQPFTPLCREAHFQVKMYKAPHVRATFGGSDVEKVHAVVARSTFRSQNVQNTPFLDHFWKLRCRKSARRCATKHISKSKCTKHYMFAPLLEVQMSNKCTPLWREAHFQVKMHKAPHVRATFGGSDVEKVHAVVARSISKSKCTKHYMFAPLLEVRMLKKCTPLWREAHFQVKMHKAPGVRTTFGGSDHSPIGFLFLKLPPPPCAALLVYNFILRVNLLLVFWHIRCIPHQNSQRLFWASVWVSLCVCVDGGGGGAGGRSGYRTKNKNPTRQCGQ